MFDVVGQRVNGKVLAAKADRSSLFLVFSCGRTTEYLLRIVDAASRVIEGGVYLRPLHAWHWMAFAGDQITRGFVSFRMLRRLTDIESTMHTFVESVKDVYTSQGVELNDKHISVRCFACSGYQRVSLRTCLVSTCGPPLQRLSKNIARLLVVLLPRGRGNRGTLKVASSIDSWLSSAHRSSVLQAFLPLQLSRDVDHLLDLKSNVIVGSRFLQVRVSAYNDVELTCTTAPRLMAQPLLLLSLFQTGHQLELNIEGSSFL